VLRSPRPDLPVRPSGRRTGFEDRRPGSQGRRRLALTPSKTRDGKTNDYGLGWMVTVDSSGKPIEQGHNGGWSGFRTSYVHNLKDEVSIIILGNRNDLEAEKLSDQIRTVLRKRNGGK
jgi:CubicO group peptidase (beta-lactamase class C family)